MPPIDPESIKTLSQTPPPAARHPKNLKPWRECQARIAEIEQTLGLPKSEPVSNLLVANGIVNHLEAMLDIARQQHEESVKAPLAAKRAIAPAEPEKFGRDRAISAVKILGADKPARKAHEGLRGRDRMKATMVIEGVNS